MASSYEFVTIGGGEFFVEVFNGIAMVVKSGDFKTVLKTSLVISFLISMLNAAFMGSLMDSGKWFFTTLLVTQTLLYPKASLHVTDKTNPTLIGAQIDNVPWIIAFSAEATSQVGYSLTKQFEAVYSLPNDLKYNENGMIFGVNMLKAMNQAKITNTNLASSVDSFARNCIFYDIMLGAYSMEDFTNSTDIWSFVLDKQSENRFITYTSQSNVVSYPTCKEGGSLIANDWNEEFNSNKLTKSLAIFAKKPDLTKTLLSSSSPEIANYFLNVSESSTKLLKQAMTINAIHDAMENAEAESQVSSYQNARAKFQATSTYQAMGAQAGIWIPMLKIVIEALFYAAFPIVILVCMLPSMTMTVLRGYFTTFFWLASWGPLNAILHRMSMGRGQEYSLALGDSHNLGITLYNQTPLIQIMNDIAAMAGYMSMFVPMIALGLARGGAAAMGTMTTSFMMGVQGAVSQATAEGTTGNLAFGNVGLNSRMVHSGIQMTNDAGQIARLHNNGSYSIDNSRVESQLGFEIHGSNNISSALTTASSTAESIAQSRSMQAAQFTSHGYEQILNNHKAIENSNNYQQNWNAEERGSLTKANEAVNDFARGHNITRDKSASIFANIHAGINAPKFLGINAGASAGADGKISSFDQDIYNEAQNYSQRHHLAKDFQNIKGAMQSHNLNLSDSKGETINDSFNKADSLHKEAGLYHEKARRYNEEAQYVESHSYEVNHNLSAEFMRYANSKYDSVSEVMQILDPNNPNHAKRDELIEEFKSYKTQNIINNATKPEFDSSYNIASRNMSHRYRPEGQMSNDAFFGNGRNSIDNSNLRSEVGDRVSNMDNMIKSAKIDSSPKTEIREKQEVGLAKETINDAWDKVKPFGEAISNAAKPKAPKFDIDNPDPGNLATNRFIEVQTKLYNQDKKED